MQHAVCALILDTLTNKVLSVSRKDDETDFGLVGGKLENDEDWISGLKREVMEETGCSVDVLPIYYSDVDVKNNFIVRTYICINPIPVTTISPSETGVIKYCTFDELTNGSFGDYNYRMFKHFKLI